MIATITERANEKPAPTARKAPIGGKWSKDEDERLKAIVDQQGPKNWKKIAGKLVWAAWWRARWGVGGLRGGKRSTTPPAHPPPSPTLRPRVTAATVPAATIGTPKAPHLPPFPQRCWATRAPMCSASTVGTKC